MCQDVAHGCRAIPQSMVELVLNGLFAVKAADDGRPGLCGKLHLTRALRKGTPAHFTWDLHGVLIMTTGIAWKPSYSVGEPSLDAQHQQILRAINDLWAALDRNVGRETLMPLLDQLLRYADTHFKHEEKLMKEHGYPKLAEHRKAHAKLRKRTRRSAGVRSANDRP